MKKICINGTAAQDQFAFRGIGRYTKEISRRMVEAALADESTGYRLDVIGYSDFSSWLLAVEFNPKQVSQVISDDRINFHSLGEIRNSSPVNNIREHYTAKLPILRKLKPDIYFDTYFEKILPTEIPGLQISCVIHDAIPLQTGVFSKQSQIVNWLKGLFYKFAWRRHSKAQHVIAISNHTANEIKDYGIREEQVEVVYNGLSEIFFHPAIGWDNLELEKRIGSSKFFLYDSGLEANKNPQRLIEVFSQLHTQDPTYKLVITGASFNADGSAANSLAKSFLASAEAAGCLNAIIPSGMISEQTMRMLFDQAEAYLNFSDAEGFGFGPLQALATGLPAFVAANDVFVEVAAPGGAATFPQSTPASQVASTILADLANPETVLLRKQRGIEYAQRFTWENTFNNIWRIITS